MGSVSHCSADRGSSLPCTDQTTLPRCAEWSVGCAVAEHWQWSHQGADEEGRRRSSLEAGSIVVNGVVVDQMTDTGSETEAWKAGTKTIASVQGSNMLQMRHRHQRGEGDVGSFSYKIQLCIAPTLTSSPSPEPSRPPMSTPSPEPSRPPVSTPAPEPNPSPTPNPSPSDPPRSGEPPAASPSPTRDGGIAVPPFDCDRT